jgi:Predicted membrane protein (DUF2306)
MSSAAASTSLRPAPRTTPYFTPKLIITGVILALAAAFVARYAFRYYLHYNEAAFTDPVRGASNYWVMRTWLLAHISGGLLALLTGPFQFWTGFRNRYARVHRFMGYCFLTGVAIGVIGGMRMAINTTGNWTVAAWELALALAWFTTTSMAFYAILKRKIAVHKEWMVRAYVVTFAFVTFRILNDFPPLSRIQPDGDRANMIGWACWSIPLLFTEVILQMRRMSSPGPRA